MLSVTVAFDEIVNILDESILSTLILLRLIPGPKETTSRLLGSTPVASGVRVSVAVMSVRILAYLEQTHEFFIKQRVIWLLVMTSIGMSPTTVCKISFHFDAF